MITHGSTLGLPDPVVLDTGNLELAHLHSFENGIQ